MLPELFQLKDLRLVQSRDPVRSESLCPSSLTNLEVPHPTSFISKRMPPKPSITRGEASATNWIPSSKTGWQMTKTCKMKTFTLTLPTSKSMPTPPGKQPSSLKNLVKVRIFTCKSRPKLPKDSGQWGVLPHRTKSFSITSMIWTNGHPKNSRAWVSRMTILWFQSEKNKTLK